MMVVPGLRRLLRVTRIACLTLGADITFPFSLVVTEGSLQRSSPVQMSARAGNAWSPCAAPPIAVATAASAPRENSALSAVHDWHVP